MMPMPIKCWASTMFSAFVLTVLAGAAAGAAPDVLYVSGTGIDELDGTYIREGPIVDDKCLLLDGVLWRSENSKYVIQGFLGRFYIDESGVDYLYEVEYDGCDPGAGLAWHANARHRDAAALLPDPSVTRAALRYRAHPGVALGTGACESGNVFGVSGGGHTLEQCTSLCDETPNCAGFDWMTDGWECRGYSTIDVSSCEANSLYTIYMRYTADEAAPEEAASLAPFALRVSNAGNSALDGRYLLRRGPPVADDACFLVDGVFWEHELDPRYVIQGVRGAEWYVDEHGVDWFYSSPVASCDPGAGAWAPNDARGDALPPAPVVEAARADCYYETVQYETYLWEAQYKICNVDGGLLYTQRLSTNRWIAGLCDVSDEASAAACVERYCAAEPPQGSGGCPDENADAVPYSPPPPADDAGGSGGKSSKTGGATVAVVAVPAGLGLVLVAAAACYCYSRRRKPRPVAAKPLEVVHKEDAWRGPAQ